MRSMVYGLWSLVLAISAFGADLATPLRWDVESSRPASQKWELRSPESVSFEPRFLSYNAPQNLGEATTVRMLYWPSGAALPYAATGSVVSATNGSVRIRWGSEQYPTNGAYLYMVQVSSASATTHRAWGTLSITAAYPGGGAVTNPTVYASLDWATLLQSNSSAAGFEILATNAGAAGLVLTRDAAGRNYWSAAGAGDITAVTVAGGLLTGGADTGAANIGLSTAAVLAVCAPLTNGLGAGVAQTNVTHDSLLSIGGAGTLHVAAADTNKLAVLVYSTGGSYANGTEYPYPVFSRRVSEMLVAQLWDADTFTPGNYATTASLAGYVGTNDAAYLLAPTNLVGGVATGRTWYVSISGAESDPVFATNGVTLAMTNGWEVGSHAGLATTGALAVVYLYTNPAAVAYGWGNHALAGYANSNEVVGTGAYAQAIFALGEGQSLHGNSTLESGAHGGELDPAHTNWLGTNTYVKSVGTIATSNNTDYSLSSHAHSAYLSSASSTHLFGTGGYLTTWYLATSGYGDGPSVLWKMGDGQPLEGSTVNGGGHTWESGAGVNGGLDGAFLWRKGTTPLLALTNGYGLRLLTGAYYGNAQGLTNLPLDVRYSTNAHAHAGVYDPAGTAAGMTNAAIIDATNRAAIAAAAAYMPLAMQFTNTLFWAYALPTTNWGPMLSSTGVAVRLTSIAYSGATTGTVFCRYWTNTAGNVTTLGTMPVTATAQQSNVTWGIPPQSFVGVYFANGATQACSFNMEIQQ